MGFEHVQTFDLSADIGFFTGRDPNFWMGQLVNSSKNGENVSMTPWNDVGVTEK